MQLGRRDQPDIFNCGNWRALLAIAGFLAATYASHVVFNTSLDDGSFVIPWLVYWLPVLFLMRRCMQPTGPSTPDGGDTPAGRTTPDL